MEIWAGKSALERIRDLLFQVVFRGERAQFNIELIPLETGVVFENKLFSVHAFQVSHRGPDCFGFVFEEKEHQEWPADRQRGDATNATGRVIQRTFNFVTCWLVWSGLAGHCERSSFGVQFMVRDWSLVGWTGGPRLMWPPMSSIVGCRG